VISGIVFIYTNNNIYTTYLVGDSHICISCEQSGLIRFVWSEKTQVHVSTRLLASLRRKLRHLASIFSDNQYYSCLLMNQGIDLVPALRLTWSVTSGLVYSLGIGWCSSLSDVRIGLLARDWLMFFSVHQSSCFVELKWLKFYFVKYNKWCIQGDTFFMT